ncbi:MAG: hypothetical protein ACM3S2_05595 [Ignavibacteriales bacterium]
MKKCILILLLLLSAVFAQEDSIKVSTQNPSPMVETTRTHARIDKNTFSGISFKITGIFPGPVEVYVPEKYLQNRKFDLLIHFHGSSIPAKYAALKSPRSLIAASLNLGSGSGIYYKVLGDPLLLNTLLDSINSLTSIRLNHKISINNIILSGFSAGYGAIKRILSSENYYRKIYAVILLDGIHASYIPENKVLADGGKIDSTALEVFLKLAQETRGKNSPRKFIITHSEIFPGTFASTTEATDYLIRSNGLKRKPVLKWGPLGMQQLSEVKVNGLTIMGFAGNTGPDHIDHFQALFHFLNMIYLSSENSFINK